VDTKLKVGTAMVVVPAMVLLGLLIALMLRDRLFTIIFAGACGAIAYIVLALWLLNTGTWKEKHND